MRLFFKGLVLVGVPLFLAVILAGSMFALILQTDRDRLEEMRRRELADHACHSLLMLQDSMFCMARLLAVSGAGPFKMESQNQELPQLNMRFEDLKTRLKSDLNEMQLVRLDIGKSSNNQLQAFQAQVNSLMDESIGLVRRFRQHELSLDFMSQVDESRRAITQRMYVLSKQVQSLVDDSLQYQQASRTRGQAVFQQQIAILSLSALASIVAGLMLARWFMTEITQRLQTITDNTLRFGRGETLHPPLHGSDEIAGLDKGFHIMAETMRATMAKERALFETARDIMCILDANFRFTAVNPACTKLLGWTAENLLGASITDFVIAEDVSRMQSSLRAAESGKAARTFESRLRHAGGNTLDVLFSVYWSKYDQAFYAVAHDITERKHIDQLKQEFVDMISHDLRSPLASMFATFTLLESGVLGRLPDAADDKVRAICKNISRLVSLVNDLLDVDKLEAGKLDLTIEPTDVDSLIRQSVSEVQAIADRKNIQIIIESQCPQFDLDAGRIVQVLVNLLGNAVKFAPAGSAVTVAAAANHSGLRVQVQDRGPGILQSKQKKIFERFKQARSEDARSGAGLGLPICKLIVEQHGGAIGVDAREGSGSTFWFSIPTREQQARDGQAPPETVETDVPTNPELNDDHGIGIGTAQSSARKRSGPFDNIRLVQKGFLLVAVPVVIELIFAGSLFPLLNESFHEKQQELHRRMVVNTANNLLLNYLLVGFSMSLRPWEVSWSSFDEHSRKAEEADKQLVELTANDPQYLPIIQKMLPLMSAVNSHLQIAHQIVSTYGINQMSLSQAYAGRAEALSSMAALGQGLVTSLADQSSQKNTETPATLAHLRRLQELVLAAGIGVSLLISALCATLFSYGVTRRLHAAQTNFLHLQRDELLEDPLSGTDEIAHLDRFVHDMSNAINASRHKDRAVFENAQDVICSVSGDGTILRINGACESQWGYTRSELPGKSLWDVTAKSVVGQTSSSFKDALASRQEHELESQITTKDGGQRDILWSLSWSPEEDALIAIAHDITQRKELERLKREFIAMVSHDLRTPLSSVSATTEMLKAGIFGSIPADAANLLGTVERSGNRLLSLINNLLDIEKLEAGQMSLELQTVNAGDILQRTSEALVSLAETKKVTVRIDVPHDLAVWGDGDRLVQVGVNLLSNAIKFSPPDSQIVLSATTAGDTVEFRIADSGRGIPQEYLNTIFERYAQVQASDGKHRAGTGLGLPICKQIVEQHGGTIGVLSEVGRGSTFYFRIPSSGTDSLLPTYRYAASEE